MEVLLIFRKKNPLFYSIERVFHQLQEGWQQQGISTRRLLLPAPGISFKNLLFLYRQTRGLHSTVFHVTGDVHYSVFVLPRKRTVLTIHDCVFVQQHKGWKRWLLKKLLLDWPVSYLKHISTISEKSRQEIIALTGCSPSKITVIPNPVSADIYFSEKQFSKDNPVLLFIGSTPNKNLERVAAAIKGISCLLQIIGKLSTEQVQLLTENSIRFRVNAGLTDKEMAAQFAAADIILFPSLYEGFGLPVIEGFKAGRAVITSNISPMKETAAGAACLVDPYDIASIREGLLKIISDDGYRTLLVGNGEERVKKFETAAIAGQYVSLYRKML